MDLTNIDKHSGTAEILHDRIDRIATEDPQRVLLAIPNDRKDISQGFQDVTWKNFADTVNNLAWWLEGKIGRAPAGEFPVVSYIGDLDLRYMVFIVSLSKLGYSTLLLADVTSLHSCQHLLELSKSKYLIRASTIKQEFIDAEWAAPVLVAPELDKFMTFKPSEHFTASPTTLHDPLMILHTSGTTGNPKLIVYPHGYIAIGGIWNDLPDYEGLPVTSEKFRTASRLYTSFRLSHSGGIHFTIRMMIYHGIVMVPAWDSMGSLKCFEEAIDYGGVDGAFLIPVTVQELAKSETVLAKMDKIKFICYSGGPVSKVAGDIVSKKTHLFSFYASTENAVSIGHAPATEDWEYTCINPEFSNIEWRDVGDGYCEAVFPTHPDPYMRHYQPACWIFPELDEWAMGDVFARHPTKPYLWKYAGRTDGMIITAAGINVIPAPYEKVIETDPHINKAVLFANAHGGSQSSQITALVEVKDSRTSIDDVWPVFEKCNASLSKLTQILKSAVVILNPSNPLPCGFKGDVQRKVAAKQFADVINQVQ